MSNWFFSIVFSSAVYIDSLSKTFSTALTDNSFDVMHTVSVNFNAIVVSIERDYVSDLSQKSSKS